MRHLSVTSWKKFGIGLLLALGVWGPPLSVPAQEKLADVNWQEIDREEPLGTGEIGDWTRDEQGNLYVVTFNKQDGEQIEMLWRQLRKNFLDKGITTSLDGGGFAVRSSLKVTRCIDISHKKDLLAAYRAGFNVSAIAEIRFGLKERNGLSLQSDGAKAEVWDGAKTTVIVQKQDIIIDWNPNTKLLSIRTRQFSNPAQSGPKLSTGVYNVTGVSTNNTLSKNTAVNTQFSADPKKKEGKFSLNATSATVANKKRLKVVLGGNTFSQTSGDVFLMRDAFPSGGTLELSFPGEWNTAIESHFVETYASVTTAQCKTLNKSSLDVSISNVFGLGLDKETEAVCVANKSLVPVTANWRASPLYNMDTDEYEGLNCRLRLNVEWSNNASGKHYQSYYNVRATTGLTTLLTANAGGEGGITVANESNRPRSSRRFNETTVLFPAN